METLKTKINFEPETKTFEEGAVNVTVDYIIDKEQHRIHIKGSSHPLKGADLLHIKSQISGKNQLLELMTAINPEDMANTRGVTQEEVKTFRELFDGEFPYVHIGDVPDAVVEEFLNRSYVRDSSINASLFLFQDNLLANQMCEVTE